MRYVIICLSLVTLFLSSAAHAVSIKNLDENAYTLTVTDGGEEKEVSLKPNGIYRTAGPFVKIKLKGQKTVTTRSTYSEVMIRKGKLSLQRQDSRGKQE